MALPGNNPQGGATGRIEIDIASLLAAKDQIVRAGRIINDTLRDIGPAADEGSRQAESSLNRLEKRLTAVGRAGSLALAGLVAAGLKSAQTWGQTEFLFRKMAGSEERATAEMKNLRKMADDTGQSYIQLVEGATSLLPAIKKSNVELTKTVSIAQRLAIIDPAQGIEGAGIAIREFLSGEYNSLVRRFEMDRGRLQAIKEAANGNVQAMIDGLDDYIAEMGLSADSLAEMGEAGIGAFQAMKDEGQLALAEAFTPLLKDFVLPAIRGFRDLFHEAQSLNPELTKMAATVAAIAAVSGTAKRGLPMLGIPGMESAGKVGVTATALYAGVQGGTAIARHLPGSEVKGMSQGDALETIFKRFKQAVFLFIAGFLKSAGEIAKQINKVIVAFGYGGDVLRNGWDKIKATIEYGAAYLKNAFAGLVAGIGRLIDKVPGLGDQGLGRAARQMRVGDDEMQAIRDRMGQSLLPEDALAEIERRNQNVDELVNGWMVTIADSMGLIEEGASNFRRTILDGAQAFVNAIGTGSGANSDFSAEQIAAFGQFQDRLKEIESDAQEDRENALDNHEKAKTELEADYQRQLKTMQEDETLRRTRAIRKRDHSISQIINKAIDSEQDLYTDHRNKLASIDSKFNDDQAKDKIAHDRKMARMQRDFDLQKLKAAAKLDFQALWEIKQRQRLQKQDAQSDFEARQQDRQAEYDKALEAEKTALQQRLIANQEAEQQRIEQIKANFDEQEALRAEDRQIQLGRMADAHQLRLDQMDTQYQDELTRIDEQAKQKADMEQQAFIDLFNQLAIDAGQGISRLLGIHRQGQQDIEQELTEWYRGMRRELNSVDVVSNIRGNVGAVDARNRAANGGGSSTSNSPSFWSLFSNNQDDKFLRMMNRSRYMNVRGGRAVGGDINQTGLYNLHKGEHVMRPEVADQLRRMVGGQITQQGIMAAMAGGRSAPNMTFGDINVDIGDVGSHSLPDIAKMVQAGTRQAIADILGGYAAG